MNIYLDLDGVIFQTLPLEEYSKKDCFSKTVLKKGALCFIKELREIGEVFIVSKTMFPSDNPKTPYQMRDKYVWALKLGFDLAHSFVLPSDRSKATICKDGILIDDYSKNCEDAVLAIQIFEKKKKPWITAKNFQETLKKLRLIKSAIVYGGVI